MEEKIEKINKGKTSSGLMPIAVLILAMGVLSGCAFPKKAAAASNSDEPTEMVQITPKPEITSTPSPSSTQNPTPSPTQLPMDVDLGLTEEQKNKIKLLSEMDFMSVTIGTQDYWIIGRLRILNREEKNKDKRICGFRNLNDEQLIVTFDSQDNVLGYINNKNKLGGYVVDLGILGSGELKINEIISMYDYKQKYAKNVKTDLDYMLMDHESFFKHINDDLTHEQINEFYRTVVPREQWFIPSERYVKEVENTPYTSKSPVVYGNIKDEFVPIRFLTNDVSDEEIDQSVKKFSRM